MEFHASLAALDWQIELGATEAIGDAPVDRFALEKQPAKKKPAADAPPQPVVEPKVDAVAVARAAAEGAGDLAALEAALAGFEHCELKKGARNLVFAAGRPGAQVMIIGDAPSRDEDVAGTPFAGRAGALFDKMFAAIGLSREAPALEAALYVTNVLPWRPPQSREPKPEEIAMMVPFLERHVELAKPDFLVAMGNHACAALLGKRGVTRLRGTWAEAFGKPVLPMIHPDYLLRQPLAKREAWADLLDLKARLGA